MPLPQIFATVPANTRVAGQALDTDLDQIGTMGVYPCSCSGTNSIALVPFPNLPTLSAYANYQRFAFVAAGTSTGPVTIDFAGLGALPWYFADGTSQLTTGNVIVGEYYDVAFIQYLNGGGGGFISAAASTATAGLPGANTITNAMLVPMPPHTLKGNAQAITTNPQDLTVSQSLILLIGTDTPHLIPGIGIDITGTWPNQTINVTLELTHSAIGFSHFATFGVSEVAMRWKAPIAFTIAAGLAGTQVSVGGAPSDGTQTFSLQKNTVQFGTIQITTGGGVALTAASLTTFAIADTLTIVAPALPDSTMSDIGVALLIVRI